VSKNLFLCGVPPHHPASPVGAYRKALPKEIKQIMTVFVTDGAERTSLAIAR